MKEFSLLGEFADPTTEYNFQCSRWNETRKRIRFVCFFTALAYLAAFIGDYLVLEDNTKIYIMLTSRFVVFSFGITTFFLSLSKKCNTPRLHWTLYIYMAAIVFCESLEQVVKRDLMSFDGMPMTAIIILCYYFFHPPRMLPTLIVAAGGSILYVFTLIFLTFAPADIIWNTVLFMFLINGFGLYFHTRFGLGQRREYMALLRLKELAEIDSLTGVFNRRRVIELGERLLKHSVRYKEPFAVLMLDIDRFKAVNDTYGHSAGDQVLHAVAQRCQQEMREVDIFGRLGGEEFVAFLSHSDLSKAMSIGERLCKIIAGNKINVSGFEIGVTVSIGVTARTTDDTDIDILLRNADMALYRAKDSGRNRVCD